MPGRVPQELLTSSLGPVLDLSQGGMRVLSTRAPSRERLDVSLGSGSLKVRLEARVAWARRLGFRRHEIGLSFENVDDEVSRVLARICADHRAPDCGVGRKEEAA